MAVAFQSDLDIKNRALQHCGVRRMASTGEVSKNASEVNFVYDKVRRAELRRNTWTFATRRAPLRAFDTTTMQIVPQAWTTSGVYVVGSVVTRGGYTYISTAFPNTNLDPLTTPTAWTQYFGPVTAEAWDTTGRTSYYAGELVYTPATEGYVVYLSLVSDNTDVPGAYPEWSDIATYNIGDTVMLSPPLIPVLSEPGDIPVLSEPGDIPVFSTNPFGVTTYWQSIKDLNVGIQPDTDTTSSWVQVPVTNQPDYRTGANWLRLDTLVRSFVLVWPLGAGPLGQPSTKNVFQLPFGYLRKAAQNPKAGVGDFTGLGGEDSEDWEFDGQFIVSSREGPILFRFVADVADVTLMDDLYCEGLGARIAAEVVEPLTQSSGKMADIRRAYKTAISEARTVNGIEQGPIEAPEDDYLTVRR